MRYKANGSAEMTDLPLVRACASPLISMVRDSSATVVSAAMPHPVQEIESNSTFPMALPFVNDLGANDGNAQAR